ncbi:hypothetical protein GEMRC1_009279 [Eukaryota sp. GEM-RC1]
MPRVDSTYKVINFCTDEDFVLLILSTSKCTEIRLLKTDPNHPKEGFIKQYQKRSVLADFDPNTKTLVIYWMENSNHFISTFTIDHNTSQFVKPQRTINLSVSGRYHDSLLLSGDPVLIKLALYSEGSKVVALDTTNHFVFVDDDKSFTLTGRSGISLLQPLKDELPLTITTFTPSFQLYETRDSYKLLILDGDQLTCIDLLISLQSSSLYLHKKDIGNCNIPQNSNSFLEVIPKSINKFPLRQSSKHLPTIVDHHELTVISPSNHVTISRILKDSINKLQTDGFISKPFKINVTSTYSSSTSKLNIRDFILRWIESIPIQVARIDAGVFLPLQDGHDSSQWLQMEQVNEVTAQQIAKKLRFGVFELLFSAYSHLPVSVIVCAGGQSSGKSTFLNHMFNHFFDVSGGRTTQGVWFGVRVFADRMWIAIDLEGLGSFERTAQEDCYQSLFGAALAQYFVLRTTHHFDQFIQSCLNSWSDASLVLPKGDELFKGTLLMTPRDVSDDAADEVLDAFDINLREFWNASLNSRNGVQRHALSIFPTTEVDPWPSYACFNDYSEKVGFLLSEISPMLDGNPHAVDIPRFESVSIFHQTATLLLAKLYVQDFSSMYESSLRQQVDEVQSSLHDVIAAGMIGPSQLNSDDVSGPQDLDHWVKRGQVHSQYPNYDSLTIPLPINQNQRSRLTAPGGLTVNSSDCIELSNLPDSGIILGVPNTLQSSDVDYPHLILQRLIKLFEARVLIQKHRADQMLFDSFLAALLIRRKEAITQWFNTKSSGYATESVFTRLLNDIKTKLDILTLNFRLCRSRCTQQIHAQSMSCNLECSLLHNHEGSCECLGDHACTGDCSLCNPLETHPCDQTCSHEGCDAPCREFLNVPHERHHCGKKCPLCSRYGVLNHAPNSDQHLCGNEHTCPTECQKRGNCEVLTHLETTNKSLYHCYR